MQRNDALLLDMYQAARQIAAFKADIDFEKFKSDAKTQSAIIHQFLIIGEVAKLLSDEFKKANTSIPWSAMARMRDKLIHHYRGVDLQEIWRAADAEVPKLIVFLRGIVPPATLDDRHS
jgi:uncharacterized protein with HEPN domain